MSEMVDEFAEYIRDICSQGLVIGSPEWRLKIDVVLARMIDSAVRQASQKLLPLDLDLSGLSDADLADKMQFHVTARSTEQVIRLPNSAWSMMTDAARRLRSREALR